MECKKQISAWEKVNLSRYKNRPSSSFFINEITENFVELHGDRCYGDDKSIVAGIGKIGDISACLIGISKGETTKENIERNFAMAYPEGYGKSLRAMKLAERQHMPVICFIDTPGAYCGIEAEKRGQGFAIARNLMEMSNLRVPIISLFIGQGGSGGALALGIADRILMFENSVYSILSPEGFASILWKDKSRVEEASERMKLTAENLKKFNIIDRIIDEPEGGSQNDRYLMAASVKKIIIEEIEELMKEDIDSIVEKRYKKFRFIDKDL